MKCVLVCLTIALLGARAIAQVAGSTAAKPAGRAVFGGMVTKDPGGEPVKQALIELMAENQAEGGDYTAINRADGRLRLEGMVAGSTQLSPSRPGWRATGH